METTINTIIKSKNDQRLYRYIELENSLKVVLVSDIHADKSAASMDVHIGHMADPKDREGLSHLLEHMLFLGTDKYPTVGEYKAFLTANGGSSNAGTGQEHTRYYFQVNQDAFEEATDRFAQFFIAPSLAPQYVEREKHSVHSEYTMKIKDDARRIQEVLKDTSNPAHSSSQFSVGNLTTLADRDDALLIDDLKVHYAKYYSASRMSLSLVGHENLDTLEQLARDKFSSIPNNGSTSTPSTIAPFLAEHLGVKITIEPIKETQTLTMSFPVPSPKKYIKEKPLTLISSLLGQEGLGSLYSYLKNADFIESLSTGHNGPDDYEVFSINMTLTPHGLADYEKVVEAVFAYLRLLNNEKYNRAYFEEMAAISTINFDFKEKSSAENTARELSIQLQYVAPKNLLNERYLFNRYSPELMTQYLSYLTPTNLRLVLVANGLVTNQRQAEYDTPYAIMKLDAQAIARYQSPNAISAFSLPKPNLFITKKLALKTLEPDSVIPNVIFEKSGFTFWHKQDTEFRIPKASVNVQIYSDLAGKDALSRAKNYLYNALLRDSLNEFGYPAKEAGLHYHVWSTNAGMGFGVNGYDEKQTMLLSTINNRVRDLSIDGAAFNLHKERLIRSWNNATFERPYEQARSLLSQLEHAQVYAEQALSQALTTVTIDQLSQYIKDFHNAIDVEVLVHGNILRAEAEQLAKTLYALNMTNSTAKIRANKVIRLNNTGHDLIQSLVVDHDDSAIVESYISNNDSFNQRAKYGLLGTMISAPFYQSIRTDQQLGYIVSGKNTKLENLPGLSFLIQSPKAGPIELSRRVKEFMLDFKNSLDAMSDEQLIEHQQGLIKDLSAKDKNLNERTHHYWSEINSKAYNFDSKKQIIAEIEQLTLADMVAFFDSTIEKTKGIIVQSFGKAHQNSDEYKQTQKTTNSCHIEQGVSKRLTRIIRK